MRVLVVDDDMAVVEVIGTSVNWNKMGINDVQTAYNADKAKQILRSMPVDIVISDIEMPMESGLDLLKWYREEHISGKFLLLTCHESFHYATEAIKYHAEEYLMKPFNVEMMEMVLQKLVKEIKVEQKNAENSQYGEWVRKNKHEVNLIFWNSVFSGRLVLTEENLHKELTDRHLSIDLGRKYYLVVSRITNLETDLSQYKREMILFIYENIHSEILNGMPENEKVVYFEQQGIFYFVTVCDEQEEPVLKQKCDELIRRSAGLLSSTVTCCISNPCKISEMYSAFHRVEAIMENDIVYYGKTFGENQVVQIATEYQPALQLSVMDEYLNQKNKIGFMDYLKKELNKKVNQRILDGETLKSIRDEIQQAVYAHLAREGIQITFILGDAMSLQIAEKANRSVLDMMRWVNYLLERIFEYEKKVQKPQSIIDEINQYIHEHYWEDIGRNEIGAQFYLVPEYLAKMYKKKTGKNLKDYINEYRLEQAGKLLNNYEMMVSDVAVKVGFDNFSYFSTLFKKYHGMTPNEYRKQLQQRKSGQ